MCLTSARRAATAVITAIPLLLAIACSEPEAAPTPGSMAAAGTQVATAGTTGAVGTVGAAATTETSAVATAANSTGGTSTTTGAASTLTGGTSTTGAASTLTGGTSTTTGAASTLTGGTSTTETSTTEGASTTTGGGNGTAVITDDFESVAAGSPPDAALWQLRLPFGDNVVEVSTEQAHGGSQSAKVTGASGSTMFFTENVFPLPNGVVHFRIWMRFSNADWANHNAFVVAGPGDESQEVRFGGQNNAYHANLAVGDGLSPNPFVPCDHCLAPVADQWQCLRGKLDFANNAVELFVGDSLAVDSATDGWHNGQPGVLPQSPTQLGFGWALYGALQNTVYYDDVAIGYEPIACN